MNVAGLIRDARRTTDVQAARILYIDLHSAIEKHMRSETSLPEATFGELVDAMGYEVGAVNSLKRANSIRQSHLRTSIARSI